MLNAQCPMLNAEWPMLNAKCPMLDARNRPVRGTRFLGHRAMGIGHCIAMRVIAGRYKGRRLKAPAWDGLRPTSDKLRETLFNILAPRIEGARVIDGYAGTGAIGI